MCTGSKRVSHSARGRNRALAGCFAPVLPAAGAQLSSAAPPPQSAGVATTNCSCNARQLVVVQAQGWHCTIKLPAQDALAASISSLVDQSGIGLQVGSTYAVFRTRSGAYDAEITLPASGQAIELLLQPSSADRSDRYRVSLSLVRKDGESGPAVSIADMTPASDEFVTLFVDCAQLLPGEYRSPRPDRICADMLLNARLHCP
jgi:hypothetical protein